MCSDGEGWTRRAGCSNIEQSEVEGSRDIERMRLRVIMVGSTADRQEYGQTGRRVDGESDDGE